MNSPHDIDDHVRNLIDQRAARADLHTRFPSVSEYPDSPSVYSPTCFSPSPMDKGTNLRNIKPDIPRSVQGRSTALIMSERDFLNHVPAASVIDLGEDTRSSYASFEEESSLMPEFTDPADELRLSMLGPRMRIHGRAPWEMGEDTLEEADESDSSGKSRVFGRRKGKGEGFKKGFGLGPSNPRPSIAARPSHDSSQARVRSKESFETSSSSNVSHSQGGLRALSQASSMSPTSLGPPHNETHSKGASLRNKFSLPRVNVRARTPSNYSSRGPSPLPPSPNSMAFSDSPTTSEFSRTSIASSSHPSTASSPHKDDFIHPYANPDLVVSYVQDDEPVSPQRAGRFDSMVRNDSISTITEFHPAISNYTIKHIPSASSLRQNSLPAPLASNLKGRGISSPTNSMHQNELTIETREPLAMNRTTVMGPNGIPGWMENPGSPSIQLISLAEAQAQARERARSATSSSQVPFPEQLTTFSSSSSIATRARVRSISAGAKAKSALHNVVNSGPSPPRLERGDSEPPMGSDAAKSLKHKKSGFMRLFNGKEREAIPPVPSISDAYTVHNSTQPTAAKPKSILQRVPVPTVSLPLDDSPPGASAVPDTDVEVVKKISPFSPKRTPPSLSIVTSAQPNRPSGTHLTLPTSLSVPSHDRGGSFSQSVPANTTDFPSLNLRPVSTIFSAHFADHILGNRVESPVDEQTMDIPSSYGPGSGRSPVTPGTSMRSDGSLGDGLSSVAGSEDQSAAMQALQKQNNSARKAWQRQIWELESQVRDLKAEIDGMRTWEKEKEYCGTCGRGGKTEQQGNLDMKQTGVLDRPRARTGFGDAARFGNGY